MNTERYINAVTEFAEELVQEIFDKEFEDCVAELSN